MTYGERKKSWTNSHKIEFHWIENQMRGYGIEGVYANRSV